MSVWGDYNIDSKPDKNSIKKRTLQIFKAVFSSSHVWMWELDHKDECQRIYVFESWCRRRLRVPWTARISNQSIPKEINHEYSLEGLMLKLKLQYFGHLMQRANSLEKTPMLGRNEGRRRRLGEKAGWYYWLNGRKFEQPPGDGEGHRTGVLQSMGSQRVSCDFPTEQKQWIF